jgi:hypothetical protein
VRKQEKKSGKSAKRFPRLSITLVVVLAVLAIGAATVLSRQNSNDQKSNSVSANSANRSYVTRNVAGQDVHVDSQTGEIQELTPEEKQKIAYGLRQMINDSDEGLKQVPHADGSVSMDLQGHFQNVAVARVNKDGSVSQSCVNNTRAAGAFFGIDHKLIDDQPYEGPKKVSTR